jgi:hypothetical protein
MSKPNSIMSEEKIVELAKKFALELSYVAKYEFYLPQAKIAAAHMSEWYKKGYDDALKAGFMQTHIDTARLMNAEMDGMRQAWHDATQKLMEAEQKIILIESVLHRKPYMPGSIETCPIRNDGEGTGYYVVETDFICTKQNAGYPRCVTQCAVCNYSYSPK